jgi:hypothetical protein
VPGGVHGGTLGAIQQSCALVGFLFLFLFLGRGKARMGVASVYYVLPSWVPSWGGIDGIEFIGLGMLSSCFSPCLRDEMLKPRNCLHILRTRRSGPARPVRYLAKLAAPPCLMYAVRSQPFKKRANWLGRCSWPRSRAVELACGRAVGCARRHS